MRERQMVLDLGIGEGGRYIKEDGLTTLRIGFDKDRKSLLKLRERLGTEAVLGNILSGDEVVLPFQDASFNIVDIIFPCNEIMWELSQGGSLWREIDRITRPAAVINIVMDEPKNPGSLHFLHYSNGTKAIVNPVRGLIHEAKTAGFRIERRELSSDQLLDLGTPWSEQLLIQSSQGIISENFCQITATKKPVATT